MHVLLMFLLLCILGPMISFFILSLFAEYKTGMTSEGSAIKCLIGDTIVKDTTIFSVVDYNQPKIDFEKYIGKLFGVDKCSIWNTDKKLMSQPHMQDKLVLFVCIDFWNHKDLEYTPPYDFATSYLTPYGIKALKNNLENVARNKYKNFYRLDITSSVWAGETYYVNVILK